MLISGRSLTPGEWCKIGNSKHGGETASADQYRGFVGRVRLQRCAQSSWRAVYQPPNTRQPATGFLMNAEILSVDFAPEDLYPQVPFAAELVRRLPGPDRPDYWLAQLAHPIAFAHDGKQHVVRWVVLASRLVGQSIGPSVGRIAIGLAYVLDEAQVELDTLDMRNCLYVAIAEATIS